MKIRLIWDDCEPTIDRRPTTREDIETGIHLQEFESENDLIKHLCDLSDYDESDLEDYGEDNRAKIDFLLSSMSDPGDGTPNILFLSIDGDIIQDWLEEVDGLTCSEQDVKNEQMKSLEDKPWDYDEEFDFDDEYEEHLDEDLDEETTDYSDDLVTDELLSMLNDIDLETEHSIEKVSPELFEEIGTSRGYEMYLRRLERFKNDKEELEDDLKDLKDLMRTKVLPKDEVEDLINKYQHRISKLQESINESKLEKVSSELFEDSKLDYDTLREIKSNIYNVINQYWKTVFSDEYFHEDSFSLNEGDQNKNLLIVEFKPRKEVYFKRDSELEEFKNSLKTIPHLKLKSIHKKSGKVPFYDNEQFIKVTGIVFQYMGQVVESCTTNKEDTKLINEEENQKPEWQIKKEKALEYYNKVKEWADDPKIKTACQYNIDVDRLNEWLGEDTDMIIKKQNEILTEDDNKDNTLKAAVDSAEKILDKPEVYSGSGDIERALDRALRMNKQQIRNGSRNFINVLFTGPAGAGKTGRIKAWARKNNINLVKTIAGTMDETDLGGVPVANLADGIAIKLSTTQFDSLATEPNSVLFLDEWNRAPRAVRATLLNLIQDHEIPDYREKTGMRFLPNFLFTVAAINPSDDIGYNTDTLDDAELGRVLEYEVAPDTKTWLDYTRAELNSQLEHAKQNPIAEERAEDIKEIKGRLGIAEKLVTDPRFSFDSQYDIEKSKEAKENRTGNGKILTYRNLTDVLDACDGTKADFLDLWNKKCNSLKKPTVEEILKDYKDVEDKANDVLDSGTESKVFASREDKLNKLRNQMKNTRI